MAQKSKKSKSKRMSLKQKYKIVKKVKEHHKKKAKEDKKAGRKQKAPKDPGIPSAWPFKADLLKELDWEKQRAVAVDKQRKEERKRARVSRQTICSQFIRSSCLLYPNLPSLASLRIQETSQSHFWPALALG